MKCRRILDDKRTQWNLQTHMAFSSQEKCSLMGINRALIQTVRTRCYNKGIKYTLNGSVYK